MNGYTLTWRPSPSRVPAPLGEIAALGPLLRPDSLCTLDRDALAAVSVQVGRAMVRLDDLFTIAEGPDDTLIVRGAPPIHRLGEAMTGGTLVIEGDAGDDLGASMSGGLIRVRGGAGARVGGPAPSKPRGMTGGEIVIDGRAGDHVGFRMRRGLIVVSGDSGVSPGYQMLAGTIAVLGRCGDHPGLEMRRGTLIVIDRESQPGPNFRFDDEVLASAAPAFLLLSRRLMQLDVPVRPLKPDDRLRLWSGDRFELDKGELVQWPS